MVTVPAHAELARSAGWKMLIVGVAAKSLTFRNRRIKSHLSMSNFVVLPIEIGLTVKQIQLVKLGEK